MAKAKTIKKKSTRSKKKTNESGSSDAAKVTRHPDGPHSDRLKTAHAMLCDGIDSVNSLASLYAQATQARGPGAPTHEEQDLLRAMVVMAGATLDATTKRIVKDALYDLTRTSAQALTQARKHIQRRLLANLDKRGGERLAEALLDPSPHQCIVGFIITDITGESLQSTEQLQRAASFLGLKNFKITSLDEAFTARNQIIHEMDATPGEEGSKRRRQRKKGKMRGHAEALLEAATRLLADVDKLLVGTRAGTR